MAVASEVVASEVVAPEVVALFSDDSELESEESDDYPMESIPQGQCLIVNVAHFLQNDDRPGSDVDAVKLHSLFENVLNFVVTRVDNPTLPQLHQTLIEFFQMDHSAYDAFFIIILSHGDQGDMIYTSDSQPIKIDDISDYFTASMCPTLANKPKVFIIQACRGYKQNKPVTIDRLCSALHKLKAQDQASCTNIDITQEEFTPHNQSLFMSHDGGGSSSNVTTTETIPDKTDFYFAYATIDDYEALRHCKDGSWFIYEFDLIVKHFAQKYRQVHLEDVMTKVNRRLARRIHDGRMQACAVKSSIKKHIILTVNGSFFPLETCSLASSTSDVSLISHRSSRNSELVSTPSRPFKYQAGNSSIICSSYSSLPSVVSKSQLVPSVSTFSLMQHHCETPPYPLSRSYSINSSVVSSEINLPSLSALHSNAKPGYCIVINNNFSQYDDGKMEKIREVFSSQLGFHVQVYSNLTRKGIKHLVKIVTKIDHSDLNCLVVIFLARGKYKKLEYSDILMPFESLTDIPKLFFFETKLNEKGYASFYNELVPVNVPLSYVHIVNAKVDIEETFLQHLLQTIAATRNSYEIIFQSIMKNTHKAFNTLQRRCQVSVMDNLNENLVMKHLKSHDQELEEGDGNDGITELRLALRLLSQIRNTTILMLKANRSNIIQVCRSLHISEGRPASIKQAGTALALRTTLRLSERPVTTRGRSLAVSVTDKLISMAKLEKVKAALEVDKQLMQQVNRLMVECHLTSPSVVLTLPPELFELISNCIKLYKISEGEAMAGFDHHVESMFNQYDEVRNKIQLCIELSCNKT